MPKVSGKSCRDWKVCGGTSECHFFVHVGTCSECWQIYFYIPLMGVFVQLCSSNGLIRFLRMYLWKIAHKHAKFWVRSPHKNKEKVKSSKNPLGPFHTSGPIRSASPFLGLPVRTLRSPLWNSGCKWPDQIGGQLGVHRQLVLLHPRAERVVFVSTLYNWPRSCHLPTLLFKEDK